MDFALSPEQVEVRERTLAFARGRLNAGGPTDDDEAFPRDRWLACAEMGLLGLLLPEDLGGGGLDPLTAAVALEALGAGCDDHGLVHAVVTQVISGVQINLFGSPEQKAAYLPGLADGSVIAAQAMTEPDAGSDFAAIRTRATLRDGCYVLDGRKTFITNGPIADVALVFAVTDPEGGALQGLSCFLVDAGLAGFERCRPMRKMGLGTLQNGDLVFDGCQVPSDKRLGRVGGGGIMFGEAMEWERILLFATQVGKLAHILERTARYGKTRRQFGRPIGEFQAFSHRIADMRVNLELGRLMIYKGAWLKAQGRRAALEAAIGKLFVSESCKAACLDAVQLHGGLGYMKEAGLERDLRDSVGSTIYSGTSEIQRNIIARLSGL
jgi:alkylation response protein AidB-like acyl-CoA dehydrogenase